jgi:hypothetical protein
MIDWDAVRRSWITHRQQASAHKQVAIVFVTIWHEPFALAHSLLAACGARCA